MVAGVGFPPPRESVQPRWTFCGPRISGASFRNGPCHSHWARWRLGWGLGVDGSGSRVGGWGLRGSGFGVDVLRVGEWGLERWGLEVGGGGLGVGGGGLRILGWGVGG